MQAADTVSALTQDEESIAKKASRCDASTFHVLKERYDEELHYSLLLNFFIFIQDIISLSSLNQEADSYSLLS